MQCRTSGGNSMGPGVAPPDGVGLAVVVAPCPAPLVGDGGIKTGSASATQKNH